VPEGGTLGGLYLFVIVVLLLVKLKNLNLFGLALMYWPIN
jgi:hypothetical protein